MIEITIIKKDGKYFIEISKENVDYLGNNIELIKTKDGILIKKIKSKLNNEEFDLLKKLNSFKFERRTPSNVYKTLNNNEKNILKSLIDKKIVSIYKGGKYSKTGVYSISQKIYPELTGKQIEKKEKKQAAFNVDFLIIQNEKEAQKLSNDLKEEIKNGEIRGTRGFDGKFYVASKDFYDKNKDKIEKLLEENKTGLKISEISEKTKLPESACLVILRLLAEDGEIIEKGKNVFKII